ncbi:MAG: phosphoribosylanthranilate isomerase [Dehalococcoidia bacterium]
MIPVKICGITRLEDARLAADLGAAALGFICYPLSPRYVSPENARAIIDELDPSVRKVGVFVDAPPHEINAVARKLGLDMAQLSGSESPEACGQIDVPVIKAFRIGLDFNTAATLPFQVHALLLDSYNANLYGGTGEAFDWSRIDRDAFTRPFILSGGLRAENILDGIEVLHPQAVDVSSGVEATPGVKDPAKLKRLFSLLGDTQDVSERIF